MRRRTVWRVLCLFSLSVAGTMAILALIALGLSQPPASAAAALCAAAFFIPGLFFLNYSRRLQLRDMALAHAAQLADSHGVTDATAVAKELDVRAKDAEAILRRAIDEGFLRGTIDAKGRFVSVNAARCPACQEPLAKDAGVRACPRCGATVPGG